MYKILNAQKTAAKRLGVTIKPSKLKNKKLDVFKKGVKVASIGDIRYNDFHIYRKLEREGKVPKGTANERRNLYKIRHNQECRAKGTPGFYACNILW